MNEVGIFKNKSLESPITYKKVTFGKGAMFQGDRFYMERCKNFDSDSYAAPFPLESYISIKVNKPGVFSFIPRLNSLTTLPEVVLGVLTKKNGVIDFKYIYQQPITDGSTTKDESKRLNITVSEDDLFGIDEPATLYLFWNVTKMMAYPISWTPAN